jgi:hypothetical protein
VCEERGAAILHDGGPLFVGRARGDSYRERSRPQLLKQVLSSAPSPLPLKLAALIRGCRFPTVALFFEPNPITKGPGDGDLGRGNQVRAERVL